jgi:hypothetical protein
LKGLVLSMKAYFVRTNHTACGFVVGAQFDNPPAGVGGRAYADTICQQMFATFNHAQKKKSPWAFEGRPMARYDLVVIEGDYMYQVMQFGGTSWKLIGTVDQRVKRTVPVHFETGSQRVTGTLVLGGKDTLPLYSETLAAVVKAVQPALQPVRGRRTARRLRKRHAVAASLARCKFCTAQSCICCPKCGHNDAADCACANARLQRAYEAREKDKHASA